MIDLDDDVRAAMDRVEAAAAHTRRLLAAENARLDARDADIAAARREMADLIAQRNADLSARRIRTALNAARVERDGFDPGVDWRSILAEYGLGEDGRPATGGSSGADAGCVKPI